MSGSAVSANASQLSGGIVARTTKKHDVQISTAAKRTALKKGGNPDDLERPSTATGRRARRIAAKKQGTKRTLKEANNSNTSRKKTVRTVGQGAKKGSKTKVRRTSKP
jgi:hypothetical protein